MDDGDAAGDDEIVNEIGDKGAHHVLEMLRKNSTLLYLDFEGECISA